MRKQLPAGLRLLLAVALVSPAPIAAAEAPAREGRKESSIVGDWQGTLEAGGAKLRLALHLTRTGDGSLGASLDSLDQGATGLPVETVTFEGGHLRLEMKSLAALYEGTLDTEGTELSGKWTQGGGTFPLTFRRAGTDAPAGSPPVEAKPAVSDPIQPLWLGTLDAERTKLRIAFHLSRGADGVLHATVDSLDQGAMGLPVDTVTYKEKKFLLEMKKLLAVFEGTMNAEGSALTGTWTQGGASLPLTLAPVDKVPTLARPQEPKPPLPYLQEEVGYENREAGVKLAGTLTMPRSGGPFPAVVLITGSGPEDRDETVFGHRPFLVLSDHLTRQGIAVLRVDDRGVGGSSAGPPQATSDDLVGDVLAGVRFLKGRKQVDPARIGLIGHSEGGIIAPLAAARSSDVAFIVLMAGPGLPGDELLTLQNTLIAKAMGATDQQIADGGAINERLYRIVKEEKDPAVAETKVRKELAAIPGIPPEAVEGQARMVLSPWFRFFLTHDPRPTLAKVKVPVLAINGEKDLQVPSKPDLEAIRTTLDGAGHKDHAVLELPGLNHLFQECVTGSPTEYATIEQTISPTALKAISDWILAHAKPAGSA